MDIGHWAGDGYWTGGAGANVVATSRQAEQVEQAAKAVEAVGGRALRLTCDVADRSSVEKLCAGVMKAYGKMDILINCAGKIKRAPTADFPEDE